MDTFTKEIDNNKNWIIRHGLTIILIVLLMITLIISNIKVPVYEDIIISKNRENNFYLANITNNHQVDYNLNDDLNVIIKNNVTVNFKIKSKMLNLFKLDSKSTVDFSDELFVNGKIFVKKEALIRVIIDSF